MFDFMDEIPTYLAVIVLIVGFVLLIKGADIFVEGSSNIAKKFKVPSLIIGLTVVAMGTSLPETAVSVSASLRGSNSLAISNAIGSNIANLILIIGVCSALTVLHIKKETVKIWLPVSFGCALLLLILGITGSEVGRIEGLLILGLFIVYIVLVVVMAVKGHGQAEENIDEVREISVPQAILFIIVGAAGIAIGGNAVVDSAVNIATALGVSETLVGLTIVAIGTSLPELVTSITAARKNELDMALGNVVGSNIFNILFVLGIACSISPISFLPENITDIIILMVMTLIVWIMAAVRKKFFRREGIFLLAMYAAYIIYIMAR